MSLSTFFRSSAIEIHRLFHFQGQDVGHSFDNRLDRTRSMPSGSGRPRFTASACSNVRPSSFCKQARVLTATDRRVARKHRASAVEDVDIHGCRANIQKRNNFAGLWLIVKFVAVLQRESIDIDYHRLFAGQLDRLFHIRNLVALACRHQNVQRVR